MNSVIIKSVDRDLIKKAVLDYSAQLREKHPEISRVIWFGSWVTGLPAPGSDVDLCIILTETKKPFHDRISDFLPVGFPVGIDLCVYTQEEFERLRQTHPGWFEAINSGLDV